MGLRYVVITSVNRDDDNIGAAEVFAETIRLIRELTPDCQVEVLIPDFQGREDALKIVIDAKPEILNHNTETVPRLYRAVRSGARYQRVANKGYLTHIHALRVVLYHRGQATTEPRRNHRPSGRWRGRILRA